MNQLSRQRILRKRGSTGCDLALAISPVDAKGQVAIMGFGHIAKKEKRKKKKKWGVGTNLQLGGPQ